MPRFKQSNSHTPCFVLSITLLLLLCLAIGYAVQTNKLTIHDTLISNRINPTLITPQILYKQSNHNLIRSIPLHKLSHNINETKTPGHYGIVYTGNTQHFKYIYISISILTHLGLVSFPIEIFINGANYDDDMNKCQQIFIHEFRSKFPNMRCVYIHDDLQYRFSYKILALLRTSFQHVLFLDHDNIIIQSPMILFQSMHYIAAGAIFWPDFWGSNCDGLFDGGLILYTACLEGNGIYDILDKTYINYDEDDLKYTQSQESGQLMIDTLRYYDTLEAVFNCSKMGKYQRYLHGDKDCFRFMFLERNKPFYYNPIMPQYVGFTWTDDKGDTYFYRHSLLQFWGNKNNVMFIHQTKWIEPMDHTLWEYYQEMNHDWMCPVHNGQDNIFPVSMDENYSYVIRETKTGKTNGPLIDGLEAVWVGFWHKYHSLNDTFT